MVEVYDIGGGACRKLEWGGAINSGVAQLAGYDIVDEKNNGVQKFYVKRKTFNRL